MSNKEKLEIEIDLMERLLDNSNIKNLDYQVVYGIKIFLEKEYEKLEETS